MNLRLFFLPLLALAGCSGPGERLPILGHREAITREVDGKTVTDTLYQTIPAFRFLNQDSVWVSEQDFSGKIYVADFFFTRCPSICPVMHRNMLDVYKAFQDRSDVKILSHSIDPKFDGPSVMKAYASKLGISGRQWEFVTGERDSIYKIAEKSYLVAVAEEKQAPGGYIHQGYFVLVDKEKRLRGAYDGTKPDDVKKMIDDMRTLLDEYDQK